MNKTDLVVGEEYAFSTYTRYDLGHKSLARGKVTDKCKGERAVVQVMELVQDTGLNLADRGKISTRNIVGAWADHLKVKQMLEAAEAVEEAKEQAAWDKWLDTLRPYVEKMTSLTEYYEDTFLNQGIAELENPRYRYRHTNVCETPDEETLHCTVGFLVAQATRIVMLEQELTEVRTALIRARYQGA